MYHGAMTPKERDFCMHYVRLGAAHAACLAAGYTKGHALRRSAQMMKRPHIIAEIKRLRSRMNERADKSATDVVNEFAKIAFTDRVDFLKPDPLREGEFMYKAPDELTVSQRAVVEKVTWVLTERAATDEDGSVVSSWRQEYNYIFSDKAKALEQMGRHFGIFNDKLKLGPAVNNPFVNASQKQLEQLRQSWATTMSDPKLIEDVQYKEVKDG